MSTMLLSMIIEIKKYVSMLWWPPYFVTVTQLDSMVKLPPPPKIKKTANKMRLKSTSGFDSTHGLFSVGK